MKSRKGAIVALLLLATCNEESMQSNEQATGDQTMIARERLGKVPANEVATWQKVGGTSLPNGRYLQAGAFDESRKAVVIFGGMVLNSQTYSVSPNQETWEWSTATGKWTNRTGTGTMPDARSGAAMVYDSAHGKFILFGGRAASGYNYEDTWEWDPSTGAWTDVTSAGSHPSARSQHVMVYEKSTGKVLLFGGGRSDSSSYDGTGITVSMGDTWEYDPSAHAWSAMTTTGAPSVRHDTAMVWDSSRNKAVLFGGMQKDIAGATGVPKQDIWEWDPTTAAWTERTAQGNKPSQRYAHAMAFDGSRGKMVLYGGTDISTGAAVNDLWDWDPSTGAWSERASPTTFAGPSARVYATMVSDDSRARIELVAGYTTTSYGGTGGIILFPLLVPYGSQGSREVWELDPATVTFVDRSSPADAPPGRASHAMAYNPTTGKTYVFGGYGINGAALNDLWEWNGTTWNQVTTTVSPQARSQAAMAYDPARKSLILFGGMDSTSGAYLGDTWEWTEAKGWVQLAPATSPDALAGHGMVTDSVRGKILLFGGLSTYYYYYGPDGGLLGAPTKDPIRNEVWEWDGRTTTWTNRTPTAATTMPAGRQNPVMAFDQARQKLFLYDGISYNNVTGGTTSGFWEWDTNSAAWEHRDPGDNLDYTYNPYAAYDSARRREVILTDTQNSGYAQQETWELDASGPTWYVRTPTPTPSATYDTVMVYDSGRGVVVLFGGYSSASGAYSDATWEYKVTNLANGEGCTTALASTCASGNCVDGVCCESASCSGPCKACNVTGSEGICVSAAAGTEVAGSCSNGQACDGSGNCKKGNGQTCGGAGDCASGFCVDGVCCNSACNGICAACNIAGRVGTCTPYAVGTDPQNECGGKGTGFCKAACDGIGACVFPSGNQPCASCTVCDGYGSCSVYDPYCQFAGAGGGITISGGSGGSVLGSGGIVASSGGTGGSVTSRTGGSGGNLGSGGYVTITGGAGGTLTSRTGGSGGSTVSTGGTGGKADAGAGTGGNTANHGDAGINLITSARLHRSGCSCEVGQARSAGPSTWAVPVLVLGAALVGRRIRRRAR